MSETNATTCPADELREAARLMRQRAEKATPGPWAMRDGWTHRGVAHFTQIANEEHATVIEANAPGDLVATVATAEHIASMHPAVALAVADWLAFTADCAASYNHGQVYDRQALAVARAYLGTSVEAVARG